MDDSPQKVTLFYRPIEQRDIALCFAWGQDQDVVRYLPSMPRPLTWAKHMDWVNSAISTADRVDLMIEIYNGFFPITRVIGRVHATGITSPNPEVGVLIGDKNAWGNGFATEAIGVIVQWLRNHGPWSQCHALIHPENVASIKAFEKNGFVVRKAGTGELELGRGNQLIFDKEIRP